MDLGKPEKRLRLGRADDDAVSPAELLEPEQPAEAAPATAPDTADA